MAGVVPKYVGGPITYEVVETVKGGQLVEGRVASKVGVAAAASVKVLGVATKDAAPPGTLETTDTFGNVDLNSAPVTQYVAVGNHAVYPVTYSANAAFGDPLVATANGQVAPAGAAPDARQIVGKCREPAGVVIATNPVGLAEINV